MNDRFVIKRGWNQVCMFIVTIAAILLLCAKQQILLDQILGIVCVAMIWFVLFLFFIEHDRAEGLISHNRETDFKKVLYSYTAAAVVVVFASYFPEFVKPLVFVPLIIAAFVSERLALITGIFWDSMICLVMGLHSHGTDIVLSVDNLWCDPCRDGGGSHKTGKKNLSGMKCCCSASPFYFQSPFII